MTLDLSRTLERVRASSWALDDFDWSAPGAERIAPEVRPKLKAFMADLTWIEHVGARGFAALARSTKDDTLREIYTYFHAEEQRHANAELALMRRWGMLETGELPEPNVHLRMQIDWLERFGDALPPAALASGIPFLEVALDGALCRFLLDTVDDPLCHEVFARINEDESRHLAVGFEVLSRLGAAHLPEQVVRFLMSAVDPRIGLGLLSGLPLLTHMRDNVLDLGIPAEKLAAAFGRYEKLGSRGVGADRNPWFLAYREFARVFMDRSARAYHAPIEALTRLSSRIPAALLPPMPSWVREITAEPVQ